MALNPEALNPNTEGPCLPWQRRTRQRPVALANLGHHFPTIWGAFTLLIGFRVQGFEQCWTLQN